MDDRQLRQWLADLRGTSVLPCRQKIRSLRGDGMPAGLIGGEYWCDAIQVWSWIQAQMVSTDARQSVVDMAWSRRAQDTPRAQFLPIPAPAALMDDRQLRQWLADIRGVNVLPCRQKIRSMRGDGLPAGLFGGEYWYDANKVWSWIQDQMVSTDIRQSAKDAASFRRGQDSPRQASRVA